MQRIATVAPFVLVLLVMVRALAALVAVPELAERIAEMSSRGVFSLNGVEVPIQTSFYGIRILDETFSNITIAFAYLQMYPADPIAYWQSFVFLADVSSMYAIFLAESCRPSNRGTIFQYPGALLLLSQVVPIGITSPIIFLIYTFKTSPQKTSTSSDDVILPAQAAAILPTVLVAHCVPYFISYLHPSLEARHWWNWIWQLYPVWGSVVFLVCSKVLAPFFPTSNGIPSRRIIRYTVAVLATVCTACYWTALWGSNIRAADIFVPGYFIHGPVDHSISMRTFIQYDYICSFAGAFLWLAFSLLRDEALRTSWGSMVLVAILAGGALGPGTMILGAWMWKDAIRESADKTKSA